MLALMTSLEDTCASNVRFLAQSAFSHYVLPTLCSAGSPGCRFSTSHKPSVSFAPEDELLDQHIPSIRGDVMTCSGSHTSSSGPFSHLPLQVLPSHAALLWQTIVHLRTRLAYSSPYMHCPTMNPHFGRHLVVFPLHRIPRDRPIAECHWPADKYIKCNASFLQFMYGRCRSVSSSCPDRSMVSE